MTDRFLPGVPGAQIERIINAAPGHEIERGKFDHPESSAALAANAFGWFLNRPHDLPPLPGCTHAGVGWPAQSVDIEQTVRFPWRGGRHPVLDAVVTTRQAFIGIESKRFEPFRGKPRVDFAETYWRDVWGDHMTGYTHVRDSLRDGRRYHHLDATQLVKHAFALRTAATTMWSRRVPILLYLYAEPTRWPKNDTPVSTQDIARHRQEIAAFAHDVEGNEVTFVSCSYQELLTGWAQHADHDIRAHAAAVTERFAP